MPAQIEVMADCASNYGVFKCPGSRGRTYTVSFSGSEGPAYCSCEAFRYSRDHHCKHIDRVWKGACMYNPQWKDGTENPEFRPTMISAYDAVIPDKECPACGGPMVAVRRAV